MRQMKHFPPHPGVQISTLPSSVCQFLVRSDVGSKDVHSCRSWSGSTPMLKPSGKPMDTAGLNAPNFSSTGQNLSGGAFLLQLVRGNETSRESGGPDSFQQQCSTKEMGATLLRQLRGKPGPGNSSKSTCGPGSEAGDKAIEEGSPGICKLGKENGQLAAESRKKLNSTCKTKAIDDLHAKISTTMSEIKGPIAQAWTAGDDKGAGRVHTQTKIRANAAAPCAGTGSDGFGSGSFGGGNRRQRAVTVSWVDEYKLASEKWKLAAETRNSWAKMGGETWRTRGERGTSWW